MTADEWIDGKDANPRLISVRDLNSGGKSQSNSNSGGLNLGNQNQQKQEVVFGKSTIQKTSPTSPQNSSPQKNANGGGGGQQAQVNIRWNCPFFVSAILFSRSHSLLLITLVFSACR